MNTGFMSATQDISRARYAFDTLNVSCVQVNDIPAFRADLICRTAALERSGTGCKGRRYSLKEMLSLRLIVINRRRELEEPAGSSRNRET
ncbi:hypothetical protein Mboo_2268 [Methanoregula boonei 6A8]|jgi:hypothetical protein|uniref:Uncharacterized protein n=2 Tax=Methanoregula TaxID=395331 RepID=A7IAM1_METB6|nr:hypothetical protein Mboo_2268 [Methanoregula boonei 6A8]